MLCETTKVGNRQNITFFWKTVDGQKGKPLGFRKKSYIIFRKENHSVFERKTARF